MSRLLKWKAATILGLLAFAMAFASVASADLAGNAFTLTATNDNGTATFSVPGPEGDFANWSWSSNLVATLNPNGTRSFVNYVGDPVIGAGFSVQAGGAVTFFSFDSGLLAFAPIPGAEGRASSALTVTDFDGDGAVFGDTPPVPIYEAFYNGPTTFAALNTPMAALVFSSNSQSDSNPVGPGFVPIGPPVSDMRVHIQFVLSPNDLASGTSVYVIQQRPVPVVDATWSRIKSLTQ